MSEVGRGVPSRWRGPWGSRCTKGQVVEKAAARTRGEEGCARSQTVGAEEGWVLLDPQQTLPHGNNVLAPSSGRCPITTPQMLFLDQLDNFICKVLKHLGMDSGGRGAGDPPPTSCGPGQHPLHSGHDLLCSLQTEVLLLLLEEAMAAAEESSVFFVPGICSQHTICPRQQAHVFLLVLPSPLLAWTTAVEKVILAQAQRS